MKTTNGFSPLIQKDKILLCFQNLKYLVKSSHQYLDFMYKIFINLIKLFQSAAEVGFQISMPTKWLRVGEKSTARSPPPPNTASETTIAHLRSTPLSCEPQGNQCRDPKTTGVKTAPWILSLPDYQLARMSHTTASLHCIETCLKWILYIWEILAHISVIVSPQILTPPFHFVHVTQLQIHFWG